MNKIGRRATVILVFRGNSIAWARLAARTVHGDSRAVWRCKRRVSCCLHSHVVYQTEKSANI